MRGRIMVDSQCTEFVICCAGDVHAVHGGSNDMLANDSLIMSAEYSEWLAALHCPALHCTALHCTARGTQWAAVNARGTVGEPRWAREPNRVV